MLVNIHSCFNLGRTIKACNVLYSASGRTVREVCELLYLQCNCKLCLNLFQIQESLEGLSDDEDYVPYVPLKERRRLELEKREKFLKRKTNPQPVEENVHSAAQTTSEEVSDKFQYMTFN